MKLNPMNQPNKTLTMTIADQKQEENIIEFILYMWNMEQLHRMSGFDMEVINKYLSSSIEKENLDSEIKFHEDLSLKMRSQKILKTGHISELQEIMVELHYLHTSLLSMLKDKEYKAVVDANDEFLEEFRKKTEGRINNDIEAMLTALFGFLKLKMSGQEITAGTKEAVDSFSKVLALLAKKYKLMKRGHLDFNLN